MTSWSSGDAFARTLSRPIWRDAIVASGAIPDGAMSEERWWMREARVSTVALNVRSRGGHGDVDRTLEICHMLEGERIDVVIKALSQA